MQIAMQQCHNLKLKLYIIKNILTASSEKCAFYMTFLSYDVIAAN